MSVLLLFRRVRTASADICHCKDSLLPTLPKGTEHTTICWVPGKHYGPSGHEGRGNGSQSLLWFLQERQDEAA